MNGKKSCSSGLCLNACRCGALGRARSVAQESGSQPARHLRTSDPPAIFDDTQSAPDQDVQFVRKDLRSQKKQMVAANMDLTDTEAEKFWPVYDQIGRASCRERV